MAADVVHALVPMSPSGKLRLAGVLDLRRRTELIASMCAHVAATLQSAGLAVTVLASKPTVTPAGATLWTDEHTGLNASLSTAMRRLGAPALVVAADLPWLGAADVERFLAEAGDIVVARSRDGGTGALLAREPLPPEFGPASALAHAAAARVRGLRARVVTIPGFYRDLDDASALQAALGTAPALQSASATASSLQSHSATAPAQTVRT